MSRDIPIGQLDRHPANSNVMSASLLAKLRRHIERSGRYEPLIVRPHGGSDAEPRYQVLNGHHRLEVLRQLERPSAMCEIWDVDDREALLLLATLNRLEGRDDPARRAALLAALAGAGDDGEPGRLARLVPENRAALEKALALAREPLPAPTAAGNPAAMLSPMTFFLTGGERTTVNRALSRACSADESATDGEDDKIGRGRSRAAALVAMATVYLGRDSPTRAPAAQESMP